MNVCCVVLCCVVLCWVVLCCVVLCCVVLCSVLFSPPTPTPRQILPPAAPPPPPLLPRTTMMGRVRTAKKFQQVYQTAEEQVQQERWDDAERSYRWALTFPSISPPQKIQCLTMLANLCWSKGNLHQALEMVEQACHTKAAEYELQCAYDVHASVLYQLGSFKQGITWAEKSLNACRNNFVPNNPRMFKALYQCGCFGLKLAQWPRAFAHLSEAHYLVSTYTEPHDVWRWQITDALATCHGETRAYDEALAMHLWGIDFVRECHPYNRALRIESLEKALTCYTKMSAPGPRDFLMERLHLSRELWTLLVEDDRVTEGLAVMEDMLHAAYPTSNAFLVMQDVWEYCQQSPTGLTDACIHVLQTCVRVAADILALKPELVRENAVLLYHVACTFSDHKLVPQAIEAAQVAHQVLLALDPPLVMLLVHVRQLLATLFCAAGTPDLALVELQAAVYELQSIGCLADHHPAVTQCRLAIERVKSLRSSSPFPKDEPMETGEATRETAVPENPETTNKAVDDDATTQDVSGPVVVAMHPRPCRPETPPPPKPSPTPPPSPPKSSPPKPSPTPPPSPPKSSPPKPSPPPAHTSPPKPSPTPPPSPPKSSPPKPSPKPSPPPPTPSSPPPKKKDTKKKKQQEQKKKVAEALAQIDAALETCRELETSLDFQAVFPDVHAMLEKMIADKTKPRNEVLYRKALVVFHSGNFMEAVAWMEKIMHMSQQISDTAEDVELQCIRLCGHISKVVGALDWSREEKTKIAQLIIKVGDKYVKMWGNRQDDGEHIMTGRVLIEVTHAMFGDFRVRATQAVKTAKLFAKNCPHRTLPRMEAHRRAANAFNRLKDYDMAVVHIHDIAKLFPSTDAQKDRSVMANIVDEIRDVNITDASSAHLTDHFLPAISTILEATKDHADLEERLWMYMARTLMMLKRFEESLVATEKLDPKSLDTYEMKAIALAALDRQQDRFMTLSHAMYMSKEGQTVASMFTDEADRTIFVRLAMALADTHLLLGTQLELSYEDNVMSAVKQAYLNVVLVKTADVCDEFMDGIDNLLTKHLDRTLRLKLLMHGRQAAAIMGKNVYFYKLREMKYLVKMTFTYQMEKNLTEASQYMLECLAIGCTVYKDRTMQQLYDTLKHAMCNMNTVEDIEESLLLVNTCLSKTNAFFRHQEKTVPN